PFGVNISLFPSTRPLPNNDFVDVIIQEKVAAVETSGVRGPEEFAPRLKQAGVILIHKCATVKHAIAGEKAGADAVTVVGVENGGATGMDDVTTMVMVPLAVDAVKIPVLAGGGIGDARGLVAALALGAEGVVMGTRFMAVKESPVHPKAKEWMLRARETDTVIVERSIRNTHRALRNKAAEKVLEMESKGATLQDLLPYIGGQGAHKVYIDGDLDAGMAYCGEIVGQINDIPTCKEVIDRMVTGALAIRERLDKICKES
ncbi:MAG: nitronate monooxygenase, partial [Dehalococcoidia bacterium]|nr:nitronate monooxygenase [Dehalococcoidia bacterium]